jgi:hypothetical protein
MNKYYERWKAKKLAEDPDFFHHQYLRYVERYGQKRLNEMSTKWQKAHPEYYIKYQKEHREHRCAISHDWKVANKERWSKYVKEWAITHPEIIKVQYLANYSLKLPLAEFCEVCPEDDIQKATSKHHPDYDYPQIIVSCCARCHTYMNKVRASLNRKETEVSK